MKKPFPIVILILLKSLKDLLKILLLILKISFSIQDFKPLYLIMMVGICMILI